MADPQRIDIPGVGVVEFPDTMSEADVTSAAKRLHAQAAYNSPEGQQQSAQADADVARYRSLGVPTDELGKPTRPLTFGERANDAILHPTPGMSLAADVAGAGLLSLGSPNQTIVGDAAKLASRVRLNPSAVVDFKLNQPLQILRGVRLAPKPNEALPLAQDLGPGAKVLQGPDQFRESYQVPTIDAPKPGAPPSEADQIQQALAQLRVRGRQIAPEMKPVPSHAPTPAPVEPIAPVASHPLTQPRVDVGAEVVGRQSGMTKQAVRDATGPILGEEQGAASPILPEKALQRIIDTIKALPPGGPEREAYVQAATSGKAQWQIENIRRTLEHLGLIVPAATAAGLTLRGRMVPSGGPQ